MVEPPLAWKNYLTSLSWTKTKKWKKLKMNEFPRLLVFSCDDQNISLLVNKQTQNNKNMGLWVSHLMVDGVDPSAKGVSFCAPFAM